MPIFGRKFAPSIVITVVAASALVPAVVGPADAVVPRALAGVWALHGPGHRSVDGVPWQVDFRSTEAESANGTDAAKTTAAYDNCTNPGSSAAVVVRGGHGGSGGEIGRLQGQDQGEDQGENVGRHLSGHRTIGDTYIWAINTNHAGDVVGGKGSDVDLTLNLHAVCPGGVTPVAPPILVLGGQGGDGGDTGHGQGLDQGEDQGENIGQYAHGHARIGNVLVKAFNHDDAGVARGGRGGDVHVTIRFFAACSPPPMPSVHITVVGGNGGAGGLSGRRQGEDQGEDQGENVGQFAKNYARIGDVTIRARNTNRSGSVRGGRGGNVTLAYENIAVDCSGTPGTLPPVELDVLAGDGGAGGNTGYRQGADQGEDQGENVGKNAIGHVRIGRVTVWAINVNHSGSADGGVGGSVRVISLDGSCMNGPIDATGGAGGTAGFSGLDQGEDQAEDQGENIGARITRGVRIGPVTVMSTNTNSPGSHREGDDGLAVLPLGCGD